MKRYIILYCNGTMVQQDGLNITYLNLLNLDVIKYIIDTKEGKIKTSKNDWDFIVSYNDPSLVIITEP